MGDRRLRLAQLLLVVAALGLWGASRLRWMALTSADGLGQPRIVELTGAVWAGGLVPMALLLAAVAVAALAVRGWPLRVLAMVVAGAAAVIGYLGLSQWVVEEVRPRAADLAEVPLSSVAETQRFYPGAVITLVAAAVTLVAALLLLRTAGTDPGARSRYAAPAARRADTGRSGGAGTAMSERMMWDAIDEGHDPTADSTSGGFREEEIGRVAVPIRIRAVRAGESSGTGDGYPSSTSIPTASAAKGDVSHEFGERARLHPRRSPGRRCRP